MSAPVIWRYTCTECGLITRIVAGQDHRACVCLADYLVVNEAEETPSPE